MDYYKNNANEYINKTKDVDMSEAYQFFLKYVKSKGKLLDIGFGSGRDMLYFKSLGFDVYGIDAEPKFVEKTKNKGLNAECRDIITDFLDEYDVYDYIWACASLHHIPREILRYTFNICCNLLKKDGIMYCSFKYGDCQGFDLSGRYYNYLTEKTIKQYLIGTNFKLLEFKITDDKLDRNNKWLNVILRKGE